MNSYQIILKSLIFLILGACCFFAGKWDRSSQIQPAVISTENPQIPRGEPSSFAEKGSKPQHEIFYTSSNTAWKRPVNPKEADTSKAEIYYSSGTTRWKQVFEVSDSDFANEKTPYYIKLDSVVSGSPHSKKDSEPEYRVFYTSGANTARLKFAPASTSGYILLPQNQ
jgi:hypothetical protein